MGDGTDNCTDPVRELLALLALDRLAPADEARTVRHVDACPACAAETADLRGVTSALDLLSPADLAEILAVHAAPLEV